MEKHKENALSTLIDAQQQLFVSPHVIASEAWRSFLLRHYEEQSDVVISI